MQSVSGPGGTTIVHLSPKNHTILQQGGQHVLLSKIASDSTTNNNNNRPVTSGVETDLLQTSHSNNSQTIYPTQYIEAISEQSFYPTNGESGGILEIKSGTPLRKLFASATKSLSGQYQEYTPIIYAPVSGGQTYYQTANGQPNPVRKVVRVTTFCDAVSNQQPIVESSFSNCTSFITPVTTTTTASSSSSTSTRSLNIKHTLSGTCITPIATNTNTTINSISSTTGRPIEIHSSPFIVTTTNATTTPSSSSSIMHTSSNNNITTTITKLTVTTANTNNTSSPIEIICAKRPKLS
ncbi:unnamed protein product [Schistosoma turkestanicum]|nr:unnamed protein product [Schistosoma turkestanicum]